MINHPHRSKSRSPYLTSHITADDRAALVRLIRECETARDRPDHGEFTRLVRERDAAYRFTLVTKPATDPATGATVGRVTFIGDTNYPHQHNEQRHVAAAVDALIETHRIGLDSLVRLTEDHGDDMLFGRRGEAQYVTDCTATTLAALRLIDVRPNDALLDGIRHAIMTRHWFAPDDRARLVDAMAQVDRIAAIQFSGRGVLTPAASRLLDGSAPDMILGATT